MSQHSFIVNIVTQKSASLHIAVAMIYKNSVVSFYWCPSHQCAKPGLAAAVTSGWSVLWGTKRYSDVILPQENQDQQKCFLDGLGVLMLHDASCYRKGQQCTCAWMEVGLLGQSAWFSHIVVRTRYDYSLANILQLLIYWYLCFSKIPMAWKEEVVKWGSVPRKSGTNSSCLIFSKIMKPLLNIDLVRRNAKYRVQKLSLKWSCLKWIFF